MIEEGLEICQFSPCRFGRTERWRRMRQQAGNRLSAQMDCPTS